MLIDRFGRKVNYLRVSVTDRCNLHCVYCRPEAGVEWGEQGEILSYEEIARLVRIGAGLGIEAVRLTGGEPLVRRELHRLLGYLREIPGLRDLSATTNGVLLAEMAQGLREAGLQRVNVSLDTLDSARYRRLTRGGELGAVLEGIEAAREAGLEPVKINVVLFASDGEGLGAEEVARFGELSRKQAVSVRFIEWMPAFSAAAGGGRFAPLSAGWARQVLEESGELEECAGPRGNGPAVYYRYAGAAGTLGFVTPETAPFCGECTRLRLTAKGELRLCLLRDEVVDLRGPLRAGASDAELAELFEQAAAAKPAAREKGAAVTEKMSRVGG